MTTLREFVRTAIRRGGVETGQVAAISALATTSVTSAQLANGAPSGAMEGKHLTRRDTASTADRKRMCKTFNGSTGAFVIQGANYADTTATDELLEVTVVDPSHLEMGVQITLQRLRHADGFEFPTYDGVRYWLHELTWVTSLADLSGYKVTYRNSPQLTRNRNLAKWHIVNPGTAASTALPDSYSLSGASATCARSTTGAVSGKYTAAIVRAGNNATFYQSVPAYLIEDLRGQEVGLFARIQTATASQARIQIYDGVGTSSSSYHTGGGNPEEFNLSHTVNAAATEVTFRVTVETTNGTVYVDEFCGHWGGWNESLARDDFTEQQVDPRYSNVGGLSLLLGNKDLGGQYIVYTKRPYPSFDESRLMSGAADGDDIDCGCAPDFPDVAVATGTLARAYEQAGAAVDNNPRRAFYLAEAAKWEPRWSKEAERNLYQERSAQGKRAIKRAFRGHARRSRR